MTPISHSPKRSAGAQRRWLALVVGAALCTLTTSCKSEPRPQFKDVALPAPEPPQTNNAPKLRPPKWEPTTEATVKKGDLTDVQIEFFPPTEEQILGAFSAEQKGLRAAVRFRGTVDAEDRIKAVGMAGTHVVRIVGERRGSKVEGSAIGGFSGNSFEFDFVTDWPPEAE